MPLIFEVVKIRGTCVVHNVGDKIVVEGPQINLDKTDALCIHALPSLLHYAVVLREGMSPVKLGLAKEGEAGYICCPDPCEPYTNGGNVVFKCYRK